LKYVAGQDVTESKEKAAKEPETIKLSSQSKEWEETSLYSATGSFKFTVEIKDAVPLDQAVREIKLFFKEKFPNISKEWSTKRIRQFITKLLADDGYDETFLSKENLSKVKQAFGPMLRELGKDVPRMKMKPDMIEEVKIDEMSPQFFNESTLKNNGHLFFIKESSETLPKEQAVILNGFLEDRANYDKVKEALIRYGRSENDIRFLKENFHEITLTNFKTPLNFFFVSYQPEYLFARSLYNNVELFDSVFKSPDKGFYSFPYSYKPDEKGRSQVKRENFNPDFFLKLIGKNEIFVVEMKADGDTNQKNRAKYRDGMDHFRTLNEKLKEANIEWKYHFYFLSPEDITEFFQAIRDNRHEKWKSKLMQELS